MAKSIEIDREKRLREEVTLETRDANDLQIHAGTMAKDLEKIERTVAHPLTGQVYVKGVEPGDLLEIEYLDIVPAQRRQKGG